MINIDNAVQLRKGKHAFITRSEPMLSEVCSRYDRDTRGMCLKVFYGNPLEGRQTLDDAMWGDDPSPTDVRRNTKLIHGSQIQNILWKRGISPRVYAVFEVKWNDKRLGCQLTDFVEGKPTDKIEDCHNMFARINNIGKDYGFRGIKDITNCWDLIDGKFVDPQPFAFEDDPYIKYVKTTYCEKGRYGKVYYQNEPRIGLTGGPRKSLDRIKYMKLDRIDFKGKTVWDVGAATGFFCRYAVDRGAKRVIGLDLKEPLEAAFHVGNLLKYFNIDYVECDLKERIPLADIPKADVAFYLSLNLHIGTPEALKDIPLVIFEDNSRENRNKTELEEPWTSWFKRIEFVGKALDHGNKSIYWLHKT